MKKFRFLFPLAIVCFAAFFLITGWKREGTGPQKVRLARLVIDSMYLDQYKALLKEGVEAAMAKEPGVHTLYAVFEKEKPTHLTILEMYADEEAYQCHLKTAHFQKYKTETLRMVKSLELVETDPLIPGLKIK